MLTNVFRVLVDDLFRKVLTLLLWKMKKIGNIYIYIYIHIKTFFNWIVNQYPKDIR